MGRKKIIPINPDDYEDRELTQDERDRMSKDIDM